MNLSTDIKTHWIITHKDSHHQITSEQESKLANIGLDDLINIDGNSIKGSSIAEVLTNEKYKLTYPDRNQYYGESSKADYEYKSNQTGKSFTQRMEEFYEKNPEKKNSKGYKFFQEHKLTGGDKGEQYKQNRKTFDPKVETWEQFKERAY